MPNLAHQPAAAEDQAPPAGRLLALPGLSRRGALAIGARWRRDAMRRRHLAVADLCAGTIATLLAVVTVTGTLWPLLFLPLWPLVAKLLGLYDRDHRKLRHVTSEEVPSILALVSIVTALTALLLPLTPAGSLDVLAVIALFVAAAIATTAFRSFARWTWWRRNPPELVGMIGDPEVLDSLRRKFGMFLEMHLVLAAERRISELSTGEWRTTELADFASSVDRIVVAATGVESELIGELKAVCRHLQVKLSVVSPLRGQALPSERVSRLADLPILEYNTWDPSRSTMLLKRFFDVVFSALGLIVFAPAMLAIAIATKLDSHGPVFFTQIRAGLDGRPFRMYKLRTMSSDAEARLEQVVDIQELEEPVFKVRNDPRVTRLGRWLRRYSVDEVPQLVNVLMGEMSLVGPRPEQVELVQRYDDRQRARLVIKPGVTGPMQVFGRGELTFAERLAVELDYVENASLAQDLRILIQTPSAVLRGTGAF